MKIVKKYEYEKTERCIKCNRLLKTEESKALGYGPSCYKKILLEKKRFKKRRLF